MESTWNHPFWIEGSGWVETKDLRSGDLIIQSNGKRLTIHSVKGIPQDHEGTVYNFEMENDHTFFIADKENEADDASFVWMHNEVE